MTLIVTMDRAGRYQVVSDRASHEDWQAEMDRLDEQLDDARDEVNLLEDLIDEHRAREPGVRTQPGYCARCQRALRDEERCPQCGTVLLDRPPQVADAEWERLLDEAEELAS